MSGIFSMFEVALVSSRKHRLQDLADKGSRGAKTAILMLKEPEKMLSIVQSGINPREHYFRCLWGNNPDRFTRSGYPSDRDRKITMPISLQLFIVVSAITYLTLIFAELLPKTIALSNPEKICHLC